MPLARFRGLPGAWFALRQNSRRSNQRWLRAWLAAPPARDIWLGYHRDLKRLARLRALVDHLVRNVLAQT